MTKLLGKRAIVSGASLGIGRAVAIELARSGAEVVINYRSHQEDALSAVAECESVGGKAHAVRADFGDENQINSLVSQAIELMGGVDIAVSNAVYSDRHLFLDSDMAEFRKTIDVSMWGAFHFVRAACNPVSYTHLTLPTKA